MNKGERTKPCILYRVPPPVKADVGADQRLVMPSGYARGTAATMHAARPLFSWPIYAAFLMWVCVCGRDFLVFYAFIFWGFQIRNGSRRKWASRWLDMKWPRRLAAWYSSAGSVRRHGVGVVIVSVLGFWIGIAGRIACH